MKKLLLCLLVFSFTVSFQIPIWAQNAEKLFQQGMMKEEGEGNLEEAIDVYNTIVNNVSADRKLRAKALLQVGICYEKLGNQNARKTYQKLISEYSDQGDIIAMGKERLKGLKRSDPMAKNEGIVTTQVWSISQDTYDVSPDGRYLSYIDWDNISTNIKDLYTGKTKALTNTGTWKGTSKYPGRSIFSPDSKKLAYYWFINYDSELHIINVDGSSDKIIAKGENMSAPWPVAWSPDGKYILAIVEGRVKNKMSNKLVLVSVNDGSVKVLKSYNISNTGIMDISPDNKYIVYAQLQNENSQENDIYILSMDGSMDKKLVGDLANDTDPLWTPDGKGILFMSNRYGTHDLWKLKVENGSPIGAAKLVKTTLGSQNWLLGITKDKSVYFATGNTRNDVYIVNLNKNLEKGTHQGIKISNLSNKRNVNPFWTSDGRYVAYLRWSSHRDDILGFQYLLTIYDTKTKTSKNIDTEIYGNPRRSQGQWSPDGKKILLNGNLKNSMKSGLFLFDVNTGKYTAIQVSNIDIKRKNYRFHNFSHDGKSIFYMSNDRKNIFKIDINSKKETIVFSNTEAILNFKLSNDDSKIAFCYWFENNKELYIVPTSGGEKKKIMESNSDSSPVVFSWSSDDKYLYYREGKWRNHKKVMRVSVDGGDPDEVLVFKDIFENGTVRNLNMLPDGQHIAVELVVGLGQEVWKIDGIFDE